MTTPLTVVLGSAQPQAIAREYADEQCTIRANMIELRKSVNVGNEPSRSDALVMTAIRPARDGDDVHATFTIAQTGATSGVAVGARWTHDAAAHESFQRAGEFCGRAIARAAYIALTPADSSSSKPKVALVPAEHCGASYGDLIRGQPDVGADAKAYAHQFIIAVTANTRYIIHGATAARRSAVILAVQRDGEECIVEAHRASRGPLMNGNTASYRTWLIADVVRIGEDKCVGATAPVTNGAATTVIQDTRPRELGREVDPKNPSHVIVTVDVDLRLCAMIDIAHPAWKCSERSLPESYYCAHHGTLMAHL